MTSYRKFLWLIWFVRIAMVFGTSAGLFAVYVSTFVARDVMESCGGALSALVGGSILFSTFPWLRIRLRVNQLRKQLSEGSDFNNTLTGRESIKNDVRHKVIAIVMAMISAALIIFNFLLARTAYLNSKDLELFIHMVAVAATVFMWNSFLLVYMIDEQFREIERLISQNRKDQPSEK